VSFRRYHQRMSAPVDATAELHSTLARAQLRGWLLGAGLTLLLSVATTLALVPAMATETQSMLHVWLGPATGLSLFTLGDLSRWNKRRMLRGLPLAELDEPLRGKLERVLAPSGKLAYRFKVHVHDTPAQLCEMDGYWRPQLYLSRALLERWPEEHLRARVGWLRQQLKASRHFLGNSLPGHSVWNAAVVLALMAFFMPLAAAEGGFAAWHYPAFALFTIALVTLPSMIGSLTRYSQFTADRQELQRLGDDPDAEQVFIQSCVIYDWFRWPASQRRRRVRTRLHEMLTDKQVAEEWLASFEAHLASSPASLD
jgi:hypothetical protein